MLSQITIDGETTSIEQATLRLTLHTENWDPDSGEWRYGQDPEIEAGLEIIVDEESGEDGAAAPDASWRLRPMPEDLFNSRWDDNAPDFEAWYGNDAPELENNQIEFRGRGPDGQVRIHWTSTCEDEPVVFDGWAQFTGLALQVQEPGEVEQFLSRVWPALLAAKPKIDMEQEIDFGPTMPEDRRYRLLYRITW